MTLYNKKISSVLLIIFVFVLLFPICAFADDTRIVISEIRGTIADSKTIDDFAPEFGERMYDDERTYLPTITARVQDQPAYFWNNGMQWQKKIDDDFVDMQDHGDSFRSGVYRLRVRIYVDNDTNYFANGGDTHRLADDEDLHVYVNNSEWERGEVSIGHDSSYVDLYSKEFTIEEPIGLPLDFPDRSEYDLGIGYVNDGITTFSVANYTVGGTRPYTYSKISGPSWINVSGDGMVSGSRPALPEDASVLVVQVKDAENTTAEININIGTTFVDPEYREVISEIRGTINDSKIIDDFTPVIGELLYDDERTFLPRITEREQDHPAYFWNNGAKWQKYEDGNWVDRNESSEVFESGDYRLKYRIYVDNDENYFATGGYTHRLADDEDLHIYINDSEWERGEPSIGYDSSYVDIYSKVFTIDAGSSQGPIKITNVDITATVIPTVGCSYQESDIYFTTTPEDSASWYDSHGHYLLKTGEDSWQAFDQGSIFQAGNEYALYIKLKANDGYEFANNVTITVNGDNFDDTWNASEWIDIVYSYGVIQEQTSITSITLSGSYSAPIVGQAIPEVNSSITAINGDADLSNIVNLNYIQWQRKTGEGYWEYEDVSGTFESGEEYRLRFFFEVKEAYRSTYKFPQSKVTVTLAGTELESWQKNKTTLGVWTPYVSPSTTIVGDLDLDSSISIIDVRLLLQAYINAGSTPSWSEEELALMDMNEDSKVDIIDVRLLLQAYINHS